MQGKPVIYILLIFFALIGLGIFVGYRVNLLPADASINAPVYDELFKVLFSIGTILFIGMLGLIVYSLIKFRRKDGEMEDGIPLEGNLSLEIFWTAVPAIVVLFVGLYSYDIYDRMGGMQPLHHTQHNHEEIKTSERIWGGIGSQSISATKKLPSLPIELSAMQFAFIFHYPKGDITTGELHVPKGKEVVLKMESKDVIHAFWVPEFRLKQDVIPGQPTILSFTPTKVGTYPIICAELCGPYHGGMRSTVVVEDPEDYESWFKQNSKTPVSEV